MSRSIAYWDGGDTPRIFMATGHAELIAIDAETGQMQLVDSGSTAFRDAVHARGEARVQDLERRLRASGIDFIHVDAGGSVVDPLVRFFRARELRGARR